MTIPDWPARTTQPGDALRDIFTAMGGSCELTEQGLTFTGSGRVHGIDVDLSEVGELTLASPPSPPWPTPPPR